MDSEFSNTCVWIYMYVCLSVCMYICLYMCMYLLLSVKVTPKQRYLGRNDLTFTLIPSILDF